MDNRSGDSAGGFKVQVRANATKFTNMVIARFGKSRYWSEKVRCSSKIKPRLRAE